MMIHFHGREIPETLEEILDPNYTALVIHDMQNGPCNPESEESKYLGGTYKCDRILGKLLKLREAARKAGVRVMYTQYTNQPDFQSIGDFAIYRDKEAFTNPAGKKKHYPINPFKSRDWDIIDPLKPAPNELSIYKYRIDTFLGTNFDNILRTNHVRTIVSSGIALEVGIDATARTAVLHDYFVVIPRDVVAGHNQEYCAETMKWLERSVIVKNSDEIIKVWEGFASKAPVRHQTFTARS